MQLDTYERLFNAYKDRVYRLALRITKNPDLAQDVTQEVHIKCWKNHAKLTSAENPGAWISRVARNLAIDKIRAIKPTQQLESVAYSAPSNEMTPDRAAEIDNMMTLLKRLVAELPEKQRLVFHLRELDGLQYKEISDVMDIGINEVKVALFRARRKIKERLINVDNYGISSADSRTA